MPNKKISELPDAPYKKYAYEAQERGKALTQGLLSVPTDVILIGTLDLIRELYEKIEALESKTNAPPK